ncbi:MAG: phenylalanine--tRNA ligase subunit alpha, partial [bacterium]|nr:phenylalanine--tRNA ligase subunit alpha [bacterium]
MEIIKQLKKDALETLERVSDAKSLEEFRNAYLGRKGALSLFLRSLGSLAPDKRKAAGMAGNELRKALEERVGELEKKIAGKGATKTGAKKELDISRPGSRLPRGHIHLLSQTLSNIRGIFTSMGFEVVEGPEIENEWYNFDALNSPKDHPA